MTQIAIQREPLSQVIESSLGKFGSLIEEGAKNWTKDRKSKKTLQIMTPSKGLEGEFDELTLIETLRSGQEAAFETLIDRYHSRLLRLARTFVPTHAAAEEVVQETWMKVLEGIRTFEGRSSLKTWIFQILTNRAKTKGIHERRYVSFTDLNKESEEDGSHSIGPENFHQSGSLRGHWAVAPTSWDEMTPERLLLSKESGEKIEQAFKTLPMLQREVIVLRDVEGFEATDVCAMLNITESNQRVLLHRARSQVRKILDFYLNESLTQREAKTHGVDIKAS